MKKNIYYHISIEDGLNKSLSHFTNIIVKILSDKRTWDRYTFVNTLSSDKATIHITLNKPKTIENICNFKGLSCTDMNNHNIYINANRWFYGAPKSKLNLKNYREYLINHEIFHAMNGTHNKCQDYEICPISHQYTLGIPKHSRTTSWPLSWEKDLLKKLPEIY